MPPLSQSAGNGNCYYLLELDSSAFSIDDVEMDENEEDYDYSYCSATDAAVAITADDDEKSTIGRCQQQLKQMLNCGDRKDMI